MREMKLWIAYLITIMLVNTILVFVFVPLTSNTDALTGTLAIVPILLPIDLYLGTWFGVE